MRKWVSEQARHWDKAAQGSAALRTAMSRALQTEAQVAQGFEVAMGLVDVEAFYDNISLALLFGKAQGRAYPTRILALAFNVYLAMRLIQWQGWISAPIYPGKAIATGECNGTHMARAMLSLKGGDRVNF